MLKKIVLGLVVAGVVLFAVGASRPASFRVERTTSIKAPPAKVFALIDEFRQWSLWSPWEKLDPAMKRTYSGPARGSGAGYAWEGNDQVGTGRMTIADSKAPSQVSIDLAFEKPFEARNQAEFTLRPDGDGTSVTWAMFGPSPLLARVMGLFFSMDAMIGKDFEAGLANLKAVAEQ